LNVTTSGVAPPEPTSLRWFGKHGRATTRPLTGSCPACGEPELQLPGSRLGVDFGLEADRNLLAAHDRAHSAGADVVFGYLPDAGHEFLFIESDAR
jgi:hypothetical protein